MDAGPILPEAGALVARALAHMLAEGGPWIWVVDPELRPVWMGEAFARFTGRPTRGDFIAEWREATHPDDVDRVTAFASAEILARRPFKIEYRMRRSDGAWRWVRSHAVPFDDDSGVYAGFVGATQDVHERREIEEELQAAHGLQQSIMDSVNAVIVVVDAQGRMRFVNRGWHEANGPVAGGVTGRPVVELVPAGIGERLVRQSEDVLASGRPAEFEFTYPTPRGPRVYRVLRTPMRGMGPDDPLVCSVGIDVTELRHEEERRAEAERLLQNARRLESLGTLAGGIAHGFNNMLTAVLGNIDLAIADLGPHAPALEPLLHARGAALRAAHVASQMHAYSGIIPALRSSVEIANVLAGLEGLATTQLGGRVRLRIEAAPGLPPAIADPHLLAQALCNLVLNAAESYGEREGEVVVRARVEYVAPGEPRHATRGLAPAAGAHVVIEVADTGEGMNEETCDHALEPFFSTRFPGRGLGLPVALGIARAHGGGLEIASAPGRGTTVRLLIPVAPAGGPAAR